MPFGFGQPRKVLEARELPADGIESAAAFCRRTLSGVAAKSDEKKSETMLCFFGIIVCSLVAPLFIAFGPDIIFGKVVPSVLSVVAAVLTYWVQLRNPHQLWALYRTAHRELEDQQTKYRFRIGEYGESADPDKLLAEHVARIAMEIHEQWLPLAPKADQLPKPPHDALPARQEATT
jgi:hypothetical protein